MKPRIYTYKITFKEVPHWYWGVHKEQKFGETYLGSPCTHAWMWNFYTPQVQILEFFDTWEEARDVETRLIRPDLNNKLCLNEACGGFVSVEVAKRAGKIGGINRSAEKLPNGKSRNAVETGQKSGLVWTDAKIAACSKNARKATQHQKDNKLQIYGDWEYFRRKGRLKRWGVKIDGIRHSYEILSETFIEYHLRYGSQRGGYKNKSSDH